jgi:YD repeat-containing protein
VKKVDRVRSFVSFVLMAFMIFSLTIPIEYCKAVGAPNFWTSRYYTMGLIDEGSAEAGLKGREYEYAHLPTSKWTEMVADIQSGNHMLRAELFNLPGTPLPLSLQLTYNSANANVDIGVGKGWMTSLHAVVSEDAGTHDLTYVDATGAKMVFDWDSGNSKYLNPSGFAGKAEELQAGGYKITPLGSGSITFNADGKLTEIAERCGAGKQTVSYDGSGRPETLTDYLSGREINLTWSGAGKLTAVTDPMNHEWGVTIDANSHLTELVKPGGTTIKTTFTYDSTTHKMLSQTDFDSNAYSIAYYTTGTYTGRLQTWTQPASANVTTDFAYDSAQGYSQKTTVTDGEDHAINYFFGSTSYALEKVVLGASGPDKEYVYNAAGFVTTAKDGYDKETTYAYDAVYHITSITNPPPTVNGVSFVREFTYDYPTVDGKLMQSRDKIADTNPVTWATTAYAYNDNDAPCKPSSITSPIGEETTIAYDSNGMATTITQPTVSRGIPPVTTKTTGYTYDATTKTVTRVTDTEGNDTAYTYNNNGLPTYVAEYEGSYSTGTLLHNREYTYNTVNLVTDTEDTVTTKTSNIVWNNNGIATSTTSEKGCEQSKVPEPILTVILPGHPLYPTPIYSSIGSGILPLSLSPYNPNSSSTTDTQGHTTTYTYRNDGTLHESTDYLSDVTDYSQDSYGRVATITHPNGRTNTYSYNSNSKVTLIESNSEGATSFTYDDAGRITQKVSPIQGTVNFTYNVGGDNLTDEKGTYSYDLLGRKTGISYTAGGSDTWTYDLDGKVSASSGTGSFEYDQLGNITRWQNASDYTTFSYTGAEGFTKLGLPSSTTGSTNLSSYSMAWDTNYWLQTFTPTGKTGSYSYSWSSSKEPTGITSPNSVNLSQTWTSKMLDEVIVRNGQNDYLITNSTFNANEQMTQYVATVHESGQNTFTETNDITYDANGRISQLAYDSNNRTIDYGYDATTGLLESIDYSDLGEYVIAYSGTSGNIDTVTYPNNAGTETYSYNGGLGRLSQIAFPSNKALNLTWNGKNQVTQVSYDDNGTVTSYVLSYTITSKLSAYTKSVGGIQTEVWDFHYGPFGLEKADRTSNPTITQDFTTDPTGRILSMTYTEAGGTANGEYYFQYDNFGNTTLLTDADGNRQYAALYDLNNGKIVSVWNPNSLVLVNQGEGIEGIITIKLPDAPATPIVILGGGLIQIDLTYHLVKAWNISDGTHTGLEWWPPVTGGGETLHMCSMSCVGKTIHSFGLGSLIYIEVVNKDETKVTFIAFITDSRLKELAKEYGENIANRAAADVGNCLATGGESATCEPWDCGDNCGLICYCKKDGKWSQQTDDPCIGCTMDDIKNGRK